MWQQARTSTVWQPTQPSSEVNRGDAQEGRTLGLAIPLERQQAARASLLTTKGLP